MVAADLEAVGGLAGQLLRMHHAFDPDRFLRPVDPERGYSRWFGTQLDEKDVFLLVAEDTSRSAIVGYAYARMEPKSYNELLDACTKLHDIFVDTAARRSGVGEALLREVVRLSTAQGAPRIVLLTATQNEAAQRLFKRFGFRTTMLEMTRENSGGSGT
jgi:ribosomal protein S18 acetylase RimI-like enzyme